MIVTTRPGLYGESVLPSSLIGHPEHACLAQSHRVQHCRAAAGARSGAGNKLRRPRRSFRSAAPHRARSASRQHTTASRSSCRYRTVHCCNTRRYCSNICLSHIPLSAHLSCSASGGEDARAAQECGQASRLQLLLARVAVVRAVRHA